MRHGWKLTNSPLNAVLPTELLTYPKLPTKFELLPNEGEPILKRNLKALSVAAAMSLLTILCENVHADPWIMPGSVDITNATDPEDYIPEIETIASYDKYGMPLDENGSVLGSMWCYDPETKLYCIYDNEGRLTTQKEYPYNTSNMEFGELYIQLSYTRSYMLNPEGMEAVLYLLNSDGYLYAIRIPCTVEEYVATLPAGEYTPYDVRSYDYDQVVIDCPTLPTECYVPKDDVGHLDLALELSWTYYQLNTVELSRTVTSQKINHEGQWAETAAEESSEEEETTRESVAITNEDGKPVTTTESQTWEIAPNAAGTSYYAPTESTTSASLETTSAMDSLLDQLAGQMTEAEKNDGIETAALVLILLIGVVVLTLAVIILIVYIIVSKKKKEN